MIREEKLRALSLDPFAKPILEMGFKYKQISRWSQKVFLEEKGSRPGKGWSPGKHTFPSLMLLGARKKPHVSRLSCSQASVWDSHLRAISSETQRLRSAGADFLGCHSPVLVAFCAQAAELPQLSGKMLSSWEAGVVHRRAHWIRILQALLSVKATRGCESASVWVGSRIRSSVKMFACVCSVSG